MLKRKFIISTLIIIRWISPFISFWANEQPTSCAACWSSPTNLSLINSFTTEILANIKTIWDKDPYAGKHVPPSRYDSGKFVAPKQSIVSKTLRRARESLGSVLAVKRIHLELSDLANVGDSLGVLAKNHVVLRDRQKMSKIEQDINRKKYELSVGWWRTDTIAWVTLEKMQSVIKRYEELWILDTSTIIDDWAEYGDLILLLWRLNSSVKHLVALGGEAWAKSEKDVFLDLRTSWEVAIKLKKKAVEDIKADYDCTKRYACEQSWTNIKDEMKKIKDAFKDGLGNTKEQIAIANQNLKKAYSQENLKKTFITENTLVNQLSWTLKNLKKRRDKAVEMDKEYNEREDGVLENLAKKDTTIKDWEKEIANSFATTNDKQKIKDNFKKRIQETQKTIQDETNSMIGRYETNDISDIMAYFVAISQRTNGIINKTIGSKDEGLISNLGALCEKQCSNIGNKSCYY